MYAHQVKTVASCSCVLADPHIVTTQQLSLTCDISLQAFSSILANDAQTEGNL